MADDSAPVLQLAMPATISGFELARLQTRCFLASRGVDELTVSAVELVVEECVTNTLRYGYDHDTGLALDRTGIHDRVGQHRGGDRR